TLTPQVEDLPSSLRWNFFDSASVEKFSPAEMNILSREGFFVKDLPPDPDVRTDDMVDLYGNLYVFNYGQSYSTVPVFISSDLVMHVFHVVFDRMFQSVEQKRFLPILEELTANLLKESVDQMHSATTPFTRAASSKNVAYLSVAAKLLNDSIDVPKEAKELTGWELQLINDASGLHDSPLMGAPEDYSQYKPRGHYTINRDLTRYFRAMMWYGRRSFSTKSDTLTLQALLLTQIMSRPENRILWEKLYKPTEFVAGESDDLTMHDYSEMMRTIYGEILNPGSLEDSTRLHRFMEEATRRASPAISGNKLSDRLDPNSIEKGFRVMGQRSVPDAYIFSELTSPRVGSDEKPRNMPTVLDVMSILGSPVAEGLIQSDSDIPKYADQMQKLKGEFGDYPPQIWTSNLYWCWLNALRPLLQEKGPGYPYFMRGRKWATKGLQAAVGSWTELKHDTFLLSKQSYAEMGEGEDEEIPKPPPQPKSYVEPDIEFFNRAVYLVDKTRTKFAAMGLLPAEYEKKLGIFFDQLVNLRSIAQKELLNVDITVEEYESMLLLAQKLSPIILPEDAGDIIEDQYKQMALVTDTHTDAIEGKVLEDAIGAPQRIYVAVKDASGGVRICVGYVYSDYEFSQPMSNRLTDEQWKAMVYAKDRRPVLSKEPAWAKGLRSIVRH
ncbi:MAG TPA: DUF3160 domain-containing protein, partial [Bacteroidota bacterium]|nr:DUF3160 domain-containing protein [Bacteroidota bacterium]